MLGGYNEPCYLHEFASRTNQNELHYLREVKLKITLLRHQNMKINGSIEVKLIENFNLLTSLKPESGDLNSAVCGFLMKC